MIELAALFLYSESSAGVRIVVLSVSMIYGFPVWTMYLILALRVCEESTSYVAFTSKKPRLK